jgi:high-affinity iron transporter
VALVNQHDLQFVPRVQAMALGQTLRFTNQDAESHNVHIVSPGFPFNQSMAPGQYLDYTPDHAGVIKLTCDIHLHMRGFVVVSPTPWFQVCDRDGRYRFEGVPSGRYMLTAWHEMGEPARTEVVVTGGTSLELPALELAAAVAIAGAGQGTGVGARPAAPVRPWPDVLDRISMILAASRDAAQRPGELTRARRLAEDAYWGEFEASDLETAVRKYLGFARAGELERQFREIRLAVRDVAERRRPASTLSELCRKLMLDLIAVTRELSAKGVTDRSCIDAEGIQPGPEDSIGARIRVTGAPSDPTVLLQSLKRGFRRVDEVAERRDADAAASELTTVYMMDFEPLERYLFGRKPDAVRPLEIQFNTLRGDLRAGLKGEELAARLDGLASEIEHLIASLEAQPAGTFGTAFVASLVTILREGVEVILVLAMLIALVAKATSSAGPGPGSKHLALRAIWWGTGLAGAASLATALVLNLLVTRAQGGARETLEGLVMLAAAGVLFYVSYWLVSHVEAKRWMEFLKLHARRGLELSGQGTLGLTAFLAVYREGAETALMYQALLGSEGKTNAGVFGLAAGLLLGLALLAVIALFVRATSVRLPIRTFFTLSGLFLFALAIAFAGNGVFELQNAGILLTTNLPWMGRGLPWAGLHPNLQVVSVQGLLLGGAILAWLVVPRGALPTAPQSGAGSKRVAHADASTTHVESEDARAGASLGQPSMPAAPVGASSQT